MKYSHIFLLVGIVVTIAVLISFMGSLTTYDTIRIAKNKPGKFVHLIVKLDNTKPIEYDALDNPNYLSFTAVDSLGDAVKVVYKNSKPSNLEISDRLVLKGSMKDDYFDCREILMKCPSKYKENIGAAGRMRPVEKPRADN